MSLLRAVLFEVLWKCGVDLESVVFAEMETKGHEHEPWRQQNNGHILELEGMSV